MTILYYNRKGGLKGMKKVYKVFTKTDSKGKKYYYAAHHEFPNVPIFGSISYKKSVATKAAANRMSLSVAEYQELKAI